MASRALQLTEEDAPLALELPAELTFEQWEEEGRRLSFTSHALQWFIGDWWNAGLKFGEEKRAETAKRLFRLEYQTVRNLGSVCNRVPVSRRRDNLSFSHYAELASIDDDRTVDKLVRKVESQGLSVRALRAEIAALKGDKPGNVVALRREPVAAPPEPVPAAEPEQPLTKAERTALEDAYGFIVELAEALEQFRPLERRESDILTVALNGLGRAHAERRPVPDTFEVVFVEKGRLECETHFQASRITINRWLIQKGKRRLIEARAAFVKHERAKALTPPVPGQIADDPEIDTYLPVARMAADWIRTSRYGGWPVSRREAGGWYVGTAVRTSEELIEMAVKQGFDRDAAVIEARAEGY